MTDTTCRTAEQEAQEWEEFKKEQFVKVRRRLMARDICTKLLKKGDRFEKLTERELELLLYICPDGMEETSPFVKDSDGTTRSRWGYIEKTVRGLLDLPESWTADEVRLSLLQRLVLEEEE